MVSTPVTTPDPSDASGPERPAAAGSAASAAPTAGASSTAEALEEGHHDFDAQKRIHQQIRNDPDYDDWEYGTEPLPHEAWIPGRAGGAAAPQPVGEGTSAGG
ncbi:MAG: hypothetical protein ACK59A_12310 [Cyanobacteriota bacterium]|jgi:hypothetical protein